VGSATSILPLFSSPGRYEAAYDQEERKQEDQAEEEHMNSIFQ
jgi:hypothetical protein